MPSLKNTALRSFKVSANPKLTVLHNFGFLCDSINRRNSFRLKKNSHKNVIRTGSYLAKTILASKERLRDS